MRVACCLFLFLLLGGVIFHAQSRHLILLMEDTEYIFSETGHQNLIIVDDGYPTHLTFTKNSIDFKISSGLVLMCGTDNPDGDSTNMNGSEITGNLFEYTGSGETGSHGIMAGYNVNYNIKHNYFDRVGYAVVIEGTDGMTYTSGGVHYNIFILGDYYTVAMGGQGNVPIYNNTFYNPNDTTWNYMFFAKENWQVSPTAYTPNLEIKNNIFYAEHNPNMIDTDASTSETMVCDYNIYYVEDGDHQPQFRIGSTVYSFKEWQDIGFDAHSVVMDPNFLDTIDFVPAARLDYGTDLGLDYQSGLRIHPDWVAGTYPDTAQQNGVWQVGAVIYPEPSLKRRITTGHAR